MTALGVVELSLRHDIETERDRRIALQPSGYRADHAELDSVVNEGAQEPLGVELAHLRSPAITCRRAV